MIFHKRHLLNFYLRSVNIHEVLIFANFEWGGQISEFKNLAKIIIIIALLKKNENSRIINFVKIPKIRNSRKCKHAKTTRSTVCIVRRFSWPILAYMCTGDLKHHSFLFIIYICLFFKFQPSLFTMRFPISWWIKTWWKREEIAGRQECQ